MSTIKIKDPKCPRSPIAVSVIQKKGVLGHFGPYSLLVDIKRQCPVLHFFKVECSEFETELLRVFSRNTMGTD